MNVFNKLIIKNLKLNKKRTIGTIVGIILSTALICGLATLFTSFRKTTVISTIEDSGYYHIKFEDIDSKKIESLELNKDVKKINKIYKLGYSSIVSDNENKPYMNILSFDSKETFDNLSLILKEGRYPNNKDEIVISEHMITNGKVNIKVGDDITLDIGKRELDEYELNDYNPYDSLEKLVIEKTNKYKVVGIIKRPTYALEDYSTPGYTSVTLKDFSDIKDAYIALKNPYDYKKDIPEMLEVNNYSKLLESKYDFSLNNELLRWEAFKFSDSTISMLYAVVGVLMIIIMVTSIFCIRNAFHISITEKTKMYGMLRSVGATKKQIKKSVIKEAILLSIIGIPLGIISGLVAIYILIIVINALIGDFIASSNMMVYGVSFIGIILSALLGIMTVYLSALSSSRKASKISPIESIRNSKDIVIKSKKLKTPKFISKIFKTGGVIAYKNLKRSKKKYRTTVISIVVSVFVFIAMNSFINYGFKLSLAYYTDYDYNMVALASENQLDKIKKLDNIDSITPIYYSPRESFVMKDMSKVNNFDRKECIYNEETQKEECHKIKEMSISIVAYEDKDFKEYVNSLKLDYDKVKDTGILMNEAVNYNDKGKMIIEEVFNYKKGETIKGTYKEESLSIKIGKVTNIRPLGYEKSYYSQGFLVVNKDYYENLEYEINSIVIDSSNPDKLEEEIKKLDSTISVTNYSAIVKMEKSTILVISIFFYGFIAVISLIGVTNIFNTITSNVELRAKEFATLKSIGMTRNEFNNMINLETIFYSVKSLVYGIILGLIGSYFIYRAFGKSYDYGFIIPIGAIIISIIAVFTLIFIIMKFSVSKINKKNIIETIRNENI